MCDWMLIHLTWSENMLLYTWHFWLHVALCTIILLLFIWLVFHILILLCLTISSIKTSTFSTKLLEALLSPHLFLLWGVLRWSTSLSSAIPAQWAWEAKWASFLRGGVKELPWAFTEGNLRATQWPCPCCGPCCSPNSSLRPEGSRQRLQGVWGGKVP